MDQSDEGRTLHEIALRMQDGIAMDAMKEKAEKLASMHSDADWLEGHIERLKDRYQELLREIAELERS